MISIIGLSAVSVLAMGQLLNAPHPNGFVPTSRRPCQVEENDSVTGLNYYGCNNAGRCVRRSRRVSQCECCDPYDPSSWCYDGLNDGSPYDNQPLSGRQCTQLDRIESVYMGLRFEAAPGTESPLTCKDDSENMLLESQVKFAMKYPCKGDDCKEVDTSITTTFKGDVQHLRCWACSEERPCPRYGRMATDGIFAMFGAHMNTHYDESCKPLGFMNSGRCAANYDHGHAARAGWMNSIGPMPESLDETQQFITTIMAILTGEHPMCGTPEAESICLGDLTNEVGVAVDYAEQWVHTLRNNYLLI